VNGSLYSGGVDPTAEKEGPLDTETVVNSIGTDHPAVRFRVTLATYFRIGMIL
jgi:hypothetical protein